MDLKLFNRKDNKIVFKLLLIYIQIKPRVEEDIKIKVRPLAKINVDYTYTFDYKL